MDIARKSAGSPSALRGATRRRTGFSLLELLVVMTIISIMVGMLMPALSKAAGLARKTTCLNHQRQLQMLADMFSHDKGRPIRGDGTNCISMPGRKVGFGELVPEYLTDLRILYCPTSDMTPGSAGATIARMGKAEIRCSYYYGDTMCPKHSDNGSWGW